MSSRRLHHLIDCAVTSAQKTLAEAVGQLVGHLGFLVREQGLVVASGGKIKDWEL